MPSHTHAYRWGGASVAAGSIGVMYPAGWDSQRQSDAKGGGQAHNNIQPYLTANFVIKF